MLNEILITLQTWLKPRMLGVNLGKGHALAAQRQELGAQLEQMSRKQEDIDSQLRELNRQLQTNTNPIRRRRLLCQVAILTTEERGLLRQSDIAYKQLQRLAQITPLLQEQRLVSLVDAELYQEALRQVMTQQEQEQQLQASEQILDEQLQEGGDLMRYDDQEQLAAELARRFNLDNAIAAVDAPKQSTYQEPIIEDLCLKEQDHEDTETNTSISRAAA